MQKLWGVLFGVMMTAAFGLFAVAPLIRGWWLPKNVASFGQGIDNLFYLILGITGFFFVLTEAILVYTMIRYGAEPGRKSSYVHGNHQLEVVWTIVPGVILFFLALWQISVWADVKFYTRMPRPDENTQQMEVTARQWEWRVRYPSTKRMKSWEPASDEARKAATENAKESGKSLDVLAKELSSKWAQEFGQNPHPDDVYLVNDIHVWKGNKVLVSLKTRDVLHSFFLPNLRLKQDALPGKTIPVWFEALEANAYFDGANWLDGYRYNAQGDQWVKDRNHIWELACAEYCGTRHSLMRGKLFVHETKDDFLKWLELAEKEQHRSTPPKPEAVAATK